MTLILGIALILVGVVLYFYFLRYITLDPVFRPNFIDTKLFIYIQIIIPPLLAFSGLLLVFISSWIIGIIILFVVLLFLLKFSTKNTIEDTVKTLNEVYQKSQSLNFCLTTRPTFLDYNDEVLDKIIIDCKDINNLTAFVLIYEAYLNRNPLFNLNHNKDYDTVIAKVHSVENNKSKLVAVLKSF